MRYRYVWQDERLICHNKTIRLNIIEYIGTR